MAHCTGTTIVAQFQSQIQTNKVIESWSKNAKSADQEEEEEKKIKQIWNVIKIMCVCILIRKGGALTKNQQIISWTIVFSGERATKSNHAHQNEKRREKKNTLSSSTNQR